jgi:putative AlgH/UPF0301 family transcriptional regulator
MFDADWRSVVELKSGHYYKPGTSFQEEIRKRAIRKNIKNEDINKIIDLGFTTLRLFNSVLNKMKESLPSLGATKTPTKVPVTESSNSSFITSLQASPSLIKREPDDLEEISLKNGGFLLIANPCDPFNRASLETFANSVVLITHHNNRRDGGGMSTLGLILNKSESSIVMTGGPCPWKRVPLKEMPASLSQPTDTGELLWRLDDDHDVLHRIKHLLNLQQKQSEASSTSTTSNITNNPLKVTPTGTPTYYKIQLVEGQENKTTQADGADKSTLNPSRMILDGYSAWVPGQLQVELDRGSWIVVSVNSSQSLRQLFNDIASGKLEGREQGNRFYRGMLRALGGEYARFADMMAEATSNQFNVEISEDTTIPTVVYL